MVCTSRDRGAEPSGVDRRTHNAGVTAIPAQPLGRRRLPDGNGSATSPANARFWLLVVAVVYLAFVVYGSLVPLRYQSLPWEQAVARFQAMPYLTLGIASRADWVANLLLFVPLGFLGNASYIKSIPGAMIKRS